MSITFEGKPGGNGESFCWLVSKDDFIKITGHEPRKYDYHNDENPSDDAVMLFPNDVMHHLKIGDTEKRKITISVE